MRLILILFCVLFHVANAAEPIVDFTAKPQSASLWKGKEFHQTMTYSAEGLNVQWEPSKNEICTLVLPRKAMKYEAFDNALCHLAVKLPEESKIRGGNIRFMDANQEVFQWRWKLEGTGDKRLKLAMTPQNFRVVFGGDKNKKVDFPIVPLALTFAAPKNAGTQSILLKKLEFETSRKSGLDKIKFDIQTGNASRVLKPGKEKELRFHFTNPGDTPVLCTAIATFQDRTGATFQERFELNIPAKDTLKIQPSPRFPRLGFWQVSMRLENKEGFSESTRSLAYMEPAGIDREKKSDDFIFGVCIPRWPASNVFPAEAETAMLCGANALRLNFRWREIERERGKWDFVLLNKLIDQYSKYGIELMPIMSNPPKWACDSQGLPDSVKWRKYLDIFFVLYADRIRFWEIWNEPDLLSFAKFAAPEYVELVKAARTEQKRIAPSVRILTGGFASMNHSAGKKGFHEYAVDKARTHYDIHAFHGHGGFKSYADQIDGKFLPMRKKLGITAPWFANETAISAYGIGEYRQAEILFQKFLYSWGRGAVGYNWYNLRNNGFIANNPEHHYGLVTNDFYPKPVYVVYNTLATHFRGKRFQQEFRSKKGIWMFEFTGKGEHAVALWNESPGENSEETVIFVTDAKNAESVDVMGNRTPVPVNEGLVIHKISDSSEILLLKEAKKVEFLGNLLQADMKDFLIPGKETVMNVSLFNPFPKTEKFTLRATPSFNGGAEMPVLKFELKPGEKKTVPLAVALTPSTAQTKAKIDFILEFRGNRIKMATPLKQAVLVKRNAPAGTWNFIRKNREDVTALFDADPSNLYRLWSGPEDLSAKIALTEDGKNLVIRVEVTDDKHVQPYRGSMVWQGDNVQLAFLLPGQKEIWIVGATMLSDGTPEVCVWEKPEGFRNPEKQWKLNVSRKKSLTSYELTIPFESVGMTPQSLNAGMRFNALINDNDGHGREGWIQIEEGIAGNRNFEKYPMILFENGQLKK